MSTVSLVPIAVPYTSNCMKIVELAWSDRTGLKVEVVSKATDRRFSVSVSNVGGVRLLDELDLAGLWLGLGEQSWVLASTWLFEVESGGWLALESSRADFYTQHEPKQRKQPATPS